MTDTSSSLRSHCEEGSLFVPNRGNQGRSRTFNEMVYISQRSPTPGTMEMLFKENTVLLEMFSPNRHPGPSDHQRADGSQASSWPWTPATGQLWTGVGRRRRRRRYRTRTLLV